MLGAMRASSSREYQLLDTGTITSTGSQTYSIPSGTLYIEMELWGAGGSGASRSVVSGPRGNTYYSGGGGGGGGYFKLTYYGSEDMRLGDEIHFSIGAGGVGPTSDDNDGADGSDTWLIKHARDAVTIKSWLASFTGSRGGDGGEMGKNGGAGGSGGSAAMGDINTTGSNGETAPNRSDGGDGGDGADPNGGSGGDGADGDLFLSTKAQDGIQPGGGGGGAGHQAIGGGGIDISDGASGADGKVVVKAYG